MNNVIRAFALIFTGFAISTSASAMYRCGNVFQDKPCEAGVTEQRLTPGGSKASSGGANAPSAATMASPYAAQCARVGEHAQRISWKREGGATAERQISDARGDEGMINLIMSIYARRGSAPEIRKAIEGECVAEKERQAKAADILNTLQKQANPAPMGPSGVPAAGTAGAEAGNAAKPSGSMQPVSANESTCTSLKSRRASVESRLRAGGTASHMESLQNNRRDIEQQMRDVRC